MRDAERLPRVFWFLLAGAFVNRIGSSVVPLFAIYLTGERHVSPGAVGVIASLYGAGSLLSGALGGFLADRIGRRPTMILSFVWGAAAMLLVPFAHALWAIGAASFHLGLAGDLYRPAVQATIADVCAPSLRPRAYGLVYWAVNLGFAVATALGGLLARRGFGLLFVVDAATTLVFAALVVLFVEESRPARVAPRPDAERGGLLSVLSDRVLMRFVAVQCVVGMLFLQMQAALPLALGRRGIGPEIYGLVIAENGVLIVLLQPFLLRKLERMRRTRALALGAFLVGTGFAWNALPLGVAGAATSVALWTLGEIIFNPIVPALIADLAPTQQRGRYQGVGQMSFGVSALLGPAGGMLIFQYASPNALWLSCLVVGIACAGLHLLSARRLAERLNGRGAPA